MKDYNSDAQSTEICWCEVKLMGHFIFLFPEVDMQYIDQRNKQFHYGRAVHFIFLHVHIKLASRKKNNNIKICETKLMLEFIERAVIIIPECCLVIFCRVRSRLFWLQHTAVCSS